MGLSLRGQRGWQDYKLASETSRAWGQSCEIMFVILPLPLATKNNNKKGKEGGRLAPNCFLHLNHDGIIIKKMIINN